MLDAMANGKLGQRTPGHRVLLAGEGLARPVERLGGSQVPRYAQHQAPPRLQESRRPLTISGCCTGLLTPFGNPQATRRHGSRGT
jgi:hypothetical protein